MSSEPDVGQNSLPNSHIDKLYATISPSRLNQPLSYSMLCTAHSRESSMVPMTGKHDGNEDNGFPTSALQCLWSGLTLNTATVITTNFFGA